MSTTAEIVAKLNDYDGDNLFEDVVWGLDYDEEATARLDGANQGDTYVIGGQVYSCRGGRWAHVGPAA